jgi:hypothetical protein
VPNGFALQLPGVEMIASSALNAIRISTAIAVFEHSTASHAACSSKARVKPARWTARAPVR